MTVMFMGLIALMIIILVVLVLFLISIYNNIQNYIIRIEEAENNIDAVLRKRFDLLNNSIDIIKNETKVEDELMASVIKLKEEKISNFDLDRALYDGIKEFNKYKDEYPNLSKNESFTKLDIELNESEAEILAFKKYYNDIITEYNKLVKSFPAVLIAMIFKFKKKLYFDGKNMEDDDVKDFKL